eukprot:ANDGO_02624.mRNA.1 Tetratricopeptide repeat protein 8
MKQTLDPLFHSISLLRRRRFDASIQKSEVLLDKNPLDQQAWAVKCKAMTSKMWFDEHEVDDTTLADALLDTPGTAQTPRPGTSIQRPGTSKSSGMNPSMRPLTGGRPLTGFARPGTQSQGGAPGTAARLGTASGRPVTSRPLGTASAGRFVRLGTASLQTAFVDASRLDFSKYAKRPALAKLLCEYLLVHDQNARAALDLAAQATIASDYQDWWWKCRLGRCYLALGLFREAEKQFKSALRQQDMAVLYLDLAKTYMKLDQPRAAIDIYKRGFEVHSGDVHLLIGQARVHDLVGEGGDSVRLYRRVLDLDPSNVEALACLAAHYFYTDAPEVAIRMYQRLLLMGVCAPELWNNLGLSCFYGSQYDIAISCLERALQVAAEKDDPSAESDTWYNVGVVAVGIGDLTLAYQAFKVALVSDPGNAEALTNLGVLELRRGNSDAARSCFESAAESNPFGFEAHFNLALIHFRSGNLGEAWKNITKVLAIHPTHAESQELMAVLRNHFTAL